MCADRTASLRSTQPLILAAEACLSTSGEIRLVADLIPHPDLVKYAKGYSTQELSVLSERGNSVFDEPLTITHENLILEGYAQWQLAKLQRRASLTCIVRCMSREDALLHLLDRHRGSKGIGDFARILMALELEPWFRERAKLNQITGGREKGSTQLSEADRLDVRVELARAAGVSAGNISKVKGIILYAIPEIQEALLAGEIRINRAATWSKSAKSTQVHRLSEYRNQHGIRRTIALLLRKHQDRSPAIRSGHRDLQRGLRALHGETNLSSLFTSLREMLDEIDELLNLHEVRRGA